MKIKSLALAAFMTLAVTSAFASSKASALQTSTMGTMMAPSMDDQDYSGWKSTYKKLIMLPVGSSSSAKMLMSSEMKEFKDEYDYKTYKYLLAMASPEHRTPFRPFDLNSAPLDFDTMWLVVEKKLNTYRRELIREDEARGMERDRMMGKPAMSGM